MTYLAQLKPTSQVMVNVAPGTYKSESFPIAVPENVVVRSPSGGSVIVKSPDQPACDATLGCDITTFFHLSHPNSGLSILEIDFGAQNLVGRGVAVTGAADATTTVEGLYIHDGAIGISVYGNGTTTPLLSIGAGVLLINNHAMKSGGLMRGGYGLRLSQGGSAEIEVPANFNGTEFQMNDYGIYATGSGHLSITSAYVDPYGVNLISNKQAGLYFRLSSTSKNALTGLFVSNNQGPGIIIYSGSAITVRHTVTVGNPIGILIRSGGSNDVSKINLGMGPTDALGAGHNKFKNYAGSSAGTDLCVNIAAKVNLPAAGNTFTHRGTDTVCTQSGGGGTLSAGTCSNTSKVNLGFYNTGSRATDPTANVDSCTYKPLN